MHGQVAVITGGAQGIGRCLALKLAQAGASVWCFDINENAVAALNIEASKAGLAIQARRSDAASQEDTLTSRDAVIRAEGKITLWVNNAGVHGPGSFMETSIQEFERIIRINLMSVVLGTRAALEVMETQGMGKIVNMASVAGHVPAPYLSSYCATKHAVVGLTRSLRAELRLKSSSVKTLLVSPGFVETQMISKGAKLGFPEWLSWTLSTPEAVASDILKAIRSDKTESYPTLNGKVMLRLQRLMPGLAERSSKVFLTRSFKDLLLNRYTT